MFYAAKHVFLYETVRTLKPGRIAIWLVLALFPSLLMLAFRLQLREEVPDEALAIISYALVPQISCMLGLLLWASPVISNELESQNWVYLTMRQQGKLGIILGKFASAMCWAMSFGVISGAAISLIAGGSTPFRSAATMALLVVLSSACYSALYVLIGVLVYKRSTVSAVVYSILIEGLVGWIPASINQITVSYRLRSILTENLGFADFAMDEDVAALFGTQPVSWNVTALIIYAAVAVSIAMWVGNRREYPVLSDI